MTTDANQYPPLNYAIDHEDRLVHVDKAWIRFAEENDAGSSLGPDSVIGQSLWNFVRVATLQSIYRQLIEAVCSSRHQLEFDFRCDSPEMRRYMHVTMIPRGENVVQFCSQMKAIVPSMSCLQAVQRQVDGDRLTAPPG